MLKKHIDKLDDKWALIIKEKAGWQCEHCGIRGVRMEAAHVAGRRHRATRWGAWLAIDKDGKPVYDFCGHCLCHNCHQQYDEHGPLEHAIVERTVGLDRKVMIQTFAVQTVAKYQVYEEINKLLDDVSPVG